MHYGSWTRRSGDRVLVQVRHMGHFRTSVSHNEPAAAEAPPTAQPHTTLPISTCSSAAHVVLVLSFFTQINQLIYDSGTIACLFINKYLIKISYFIKTSFSICKGSLSHISD